MLVIRLTRKGRKNQPFFKVVVIDKRRSAKGGRAVEILGHVDPLTKRRSLKKERILYWLKVGAKASSTVHNLLVSEKVIEAKKIDVSKKSKKTEEVKPAGNVNISTPQRAEDTKNQKIEEQREEKTQQQTAEFPKGEDEVS